MSKSKVKEVKEDSVSSNQYVDRAGNVCQLREDGSLRVISVNNEVSLTIQSERDSVDLKKILAKYQSTGVMGNQRQELPKYGDFSSAPDYLDMQNAIIKTDEAFAALPSAVRKKFGNDVASLLKFLDDPENRSEAISLGLIEKPDDESPSSPQPSEMAQGDVKGEKPPSE